MLRSALLVSLAMLAAPVAASTYSATLVAPVSGRIVARDINWACTGHSCEGATQESRPAVLCQALVKRTGRMEAFIVDGRAFSSPELTRCNSVAKPAAANSAAAQ